ncbi:MAG: translocation/assembly module TamB domain-containing protein [Zoogloeaceae bacterium]|nr:translocation/assembly module TamB domain-containing protein [Zoogloeaceae bacterium]
MADAPPPAPGEPPPDPQAGARPRRSRWLAVGVAAAGTLVATVLLLAWLVVTPAGTAWLIDLGARLVGGDLQVEGVAGGLAGDLRVARLRYRDARLHIEAQDLRLHWRPAALRQGLLHLTEISARAVTWAQAPSDTAVALPASLRLPGAVTVDRLGVGDFALAAWQDPSAPPSLRLVELTAAFASDGRHHRLTALRVGTPWGQLSVPEARLDGQAPYPLSLQGRLDNDHAAHPYQLSGELGGPLDALGLRLAGTGAGSVTVAADASLTPFAPLPLAKAQVRLAQLDPSRFDAAWPGADLTLDVDLAPAAVSPGGAGRALEGRFQMVNGQARSLDAGGVPLERAFGHLAWSAEALTLSDLDLRLAGGAALVGQVRWEPGRQAVHGALITRDLDLRRLDRRGPATRLAGRIAAEGQDGAIEVTSQLTDPRFALHLVARASAAAIELETLRLQAAGGVAEAGGRVALDGGHKFRLQAGLSGFDPRSLWSEAPAGTLNLSLQATGVAQPAWAAQGEFEIRDSRLNGQDLAGSGRFGASARRLEVPRFQLDWAGNHLAAEGRLGQAGDRLTWKVAAPDLGRLGLGVRGRIDADGSLTGGFEGLSGAATAMVERLEWPGRLRIASLNFAGRLEPGASGAWAASLGATGVGAPGEPPWADSLALQLGGTRRAHQLDIQTARGRRDRWQAVLDGGLDDGQNWAGRLREARGEGRFALDLEAPASLRLGRQLMELGPATLRTATGVIHLRETRWTPALTSLRGDFRGLGVGLLTLDGGSARRGEVTLRLAGDWDWRMGERMDGQIHIARESGDLVLIGERAARLGLEAFEIVVSAQANRLAGSLEARGTQLGRLAASATAAVERGAGGWRLAPDAALSGSARLDMASVAWVGPLTHPSLSTEGRLEAEFSLSGTPARPVSTGWVRGGGLGLTLADLGLRLSGGTLEADFDRERLRVTRLEFQTPAEVVPADVRLRPLAAEPGRLDISGEVALAQGAGRFQFEAQRLPLLQRTDRWVIVSGSGDIATGWDSLALTTRLKADGGFVGLSDAAAAPSLSDDVVVLGRNDATARTPFRLSVDAQLDLGPRLYLRAAGVAARLAGVLHVEGRDGQSLVTRGTVTAADGSYEGYGQTLAIERGRVNFNGPLDNPALDVVALRKGLAVEAGVAITGTAKRPQVRLVSEPNVPDAEKLSWIVLGRPPDSASGSDMGLLIPAAQALLGGPGGGMTAQLANSLGLDLVSIGQGDLGSVTRGATSRVVGTGATVVAGATVSGQVVSLGKRLSADAFFSVEHSLAGAESIVKLTYQLTRHLAVVVRGGTDNAVDLSYTISFQ